MLASASSVAADRFQAPFLALLCRRMPRLTRTNLSLPFAHHGLQEEAGLRSAVLYTMTYRGTAKGLESDSSGTSRAHARAHDSKTYHTELTRFHLIKRRTRDRGSRRFSIAALDLIAPSATVLSLSLFLY
ncbi:hypothetical protein CSAL01_02703 [Colletotrichum salicis]|uniref:Uncharacterized protein n=1 Tax=Colletotrichum salicis TaxID=1209931 RepID=A0A135UQY7_9PEZI|nr:hypothetical protein CSAL01_02703 [Colletotrichum salicis]